MKYILTLNVTFINNRGNIHNRIILGDIDLWLAKRIQKDNFESLVNAYQSSISEYKVQAILTIDNDNDDVIEIYTYSGGK